MKKMMGENKMKKEMKKDFGGKGIVEEMGLAALGIALIAVLFVLLEPVLGTLVSNIATQITNIFTL